MAMASAGMFSRELGEYSLVHQFQIVTNGPLHRPKHAHSLRFEFHQSTQADPANHNPIHLSPSQSFEGLAHAMGMVEIAIAYFFQLPGFGIDNDKPGRRSKMTVYLALKTFQR